MRSAQLLVEISTLRKKQGSPDYINIRRLSRKVEFLQ